MASGSKSAATRKSASRKKAGAKPKAKSKKRIRSLGSRTEEEVLAISCGLFADKGLTAVEIMKRLELEYDVTVLREDPYAYVRKAATRGWIRFAPPHENAMMARVRKMYPWLQDTVVIETARMEDVAYRGAEMLIELLQQHYAGKEVHIGFSGGMALRTLARRFAELLREPVSHLPSKIVFHALVAGFDVSDPATDPNAFFNDFVDDPMMPFETRFVALHAPAMIEASLEKELQSLPAVKEAYDRASEIDIVVTSTSCWTDKHSMLRHCMALAGESVDDLERAGCKGDILWQPIGADRPSEPNSKIRAMTVMKLERLSELVAENKQVLLVAGPCDKCHAPKTKIVKAILDQRARLITHLVTDIHCARALA